MEPADAINTTPISTNRPSPADDRVDVWIAGDQYHEAVTVGNPASKTHRKILNLSVPGGIWYVKKILEKGINHVEGEKPFKVECAPIDEGSQRVTVPELNFAKKSRQPYAPNCLKVTRIDQTKYQEYKFTGFVDNYVRHPKEFLVIEDMDMGYRTHGKKREWSRMLTAWGEQTVSNSQRSIKNIVLLGRALQTLKQDDGSLWGTLLGDHRNETLVIVNADLLRSMGAGISRRISWERTAQDLVTFLHSSSQFANLGRFAHLIVRFGVTAAVHCFHPGRNARYRMFYDAKCNNGYFREIDEEGGIIGNNSVFAAHIIRSFLRPEKSFLGSEFTIAAAIRSALPSCQRMHRLGYPPLTRDKSWLDPWPLTSVFDERMYSRNTRYLYRYAKNSAKLQIARTDWKKVYAAEPSTEELIDDVEIPAGVETWSILNHAMVGSALIDTAQNIVRVGVERAINRASRDSASIGLIKKPKPFVPKAIFNELVTLDRDEIESFRGVYNIVREYLASGQTKPLCLAIFGPPGSGKSFTVKQIAEASASHILSNRNKSELQERVDINMSQLATTDQLIDHLQSAMKYRVVHQETLLSIRSQLRKIPFLFFDEFDCDYTGHLGWLKVFLSPMEDASIDIGVNQKLDLRRSIMVFAGGTTMNYKQFSCEALPLTDQNRQSFIAAKGPDFISRLRGHIDIKGINPVSLSDKSYLIRRAVLLRQYLKDYNYTKQSESGQPAQIDYSVLYAMLMVDTYKHGARSMKSVVAMSVPLHGRLEKSSLPALPQLDMHVESSQFHARIREYPNALRAFNNIDRHILT